MPPQKGQEDGMEMLPDRVAETFVDQTVMITGGTGFMGKVLIEKLLRKCPGIREIILLVRTKKGKSPTERLQVVFNDPLFEKLITMRGGVQPLIEKIRVVAGDVIEPDLGLSEDDRRHIVENTDIIIHAAATIRFDEALKKAVLLNVRGTKLIVELAKACQNLKLFVHISTAYCHLHEKLLEEKAYPPPADPHRVIAAAELMDEETLESIAHKFLDKLPNSYAFSKALGEALVVEAMEENLPVLILRPSIVIPIIWEPLPGWTDNINGPTGLLIGAGKGVLRSMYCRSDSYADYLPVDIFISGIMVVVWSYLRQGDKTSIYNFTSSAEVKITWHELIETGRAVILKKVPLNGVAWYPGGSMKHSRLHHNICVVLFHWLPAILVDTLLYILRYEPVLMRVQRRINKGFEVFEYYTVNQWDFKSDNGQNVRKKLNEREYREYKVDASGADIPAYFEDCVRAARRYILKEPDETIPAARRHMNVMWFVDLVFRWFFTGLIVWYFLKYTSSFLGIPISS